ncbi:fibronectin type III domain-containing protein, partial [Planctomycetota bacterium]
MKYDKLFFLLMMLFVLVAFSSCGGGGGGGGGAAGGGTVDGGDGTGGFDPLEGDIVAEDNIGVSGGEVSAPDEDTAYGATISFPQNSFPNSATVKIVNNDVPPDAPPGFHAVTFTATSEPDGDITVSFDTTTLFDLVDEDSGTPDVYYYDYNSEEWKIIEDASFNGETISFYIPSGAGVEKALQAGGILDWFATFLVLLCNQELFQNPSVVTYQEHDPWGGTSCIVIHGITASTNDFITNYDVVPWAMTDLYDNVYGFNYPSIMPIATNAQTFKTMLTSLSNYNQCRFDIVAHSMGGLVARYALEKLSLSRIDRLVTLETPHLGSYLADQMAEIGPDSVLFYADGVLNLRRTPFTQQEVIDRIDAQLDDWFISNKRRTILEDLKENSAAIAEASNFISNLNSNITKPDMKYCFLSLNYDTGYIYFRPVDNDSGTAQGINDWLGDLIRDVTFSPSYTEFSNLSWLNPGHTAIHTQMNYGTGVAEKIEEWLLPDTPPNLTATTISDNQINLSWQDVDYETDYYLYKNTTDSRPQNPSFYIDADDTNFSDTNVQANTTYHYWLSAYNDFGESDGYVSASDTTAPATPSQLNATMVSSSEIDLEWTNVDGEAGYNIYRSTNSTRPPSPFTTRNADVTSYPDTGLNPETPYYYWVSAYNVHGESGFADDTVSTGGDPPSAPSQLTATALSS